MPVTLRLLGQATALLSGQALKIAPGRPASLLVYLAVGGRWVSRAELAFLYRPDEPEAEALAYLRKLVFRARRLPWAVGLEVSDDALRWRVESDYSRFSEAAAARSFERALAAHGGEFLAGWDVPGAPGIDEWIAVERSASRGAWLGCAREEAARLESVGRDPEAAALLEKVLDVDAFDETSLQRYMLVLARQGRRGRALAAYADFQRLLEEELGGVPLESTQTLADALRTGSAGGEEPGAVLPVVKAPSRLTALPVPTSPLVGRAEEEALVRRLLSEGDERLVSVVGLGGSGKTRLAIEAARGLEGAFGQGVAYVSFAGEGTLPGGGAHSASHAVAARLLEATGSAWRDGDPEAALLQALEARELLLLLDNFETVMDAAPLVAKLLANCPRLAVLATSREPLRLMGERVVELGGLKLPEPGDEGAIGEFDSVRLFTQRALSVAPGFTPARSNLANVAEICRRLGGLPLAIELAASWSGVLGPEALLRELQRDLGLLSSRSRDVPERHASLTTVFDHTWERLGDEERVALTRLSLFRSGFDLKAARAVAGCGLEVLLSLVSHMLVRRVGEDRYVLHELVRQYAASRLQGAAEVRAAYARHFCELLGALLARLKGSDAAAALNAIAEDYGNFTAAWEQAAAAGEAELLGSAEGALDFYLYYRGRYAEAAETFARAAAALGGASVEGRAAAVRGRLLLRRAQYEQLLGRPELANDLAAAGLRDLERWGDEGELAQGWQLTGVMALLQGRLEEARAQLERVLGYASSADDQYLLGGAHNALGNVMAVGSGDHAAASEHHRKALRAYRRCGNVNGVIDVTINLGATSFDLKEYGEAERLWQEAARLATELGYLQRAAVLQNNLGALAGGRGDLEAAEARYLKSLKLRSEVGDRRGTASVLHNLGTLALKRDDVETGLERLRRALAIYLELDDAAGAAYTRSHLGRALISAGDVDGALNEAVGALEAALEADTSTDLLGSLLTTALLHEASRRPGDALRVSSAVSRLAAGSNENIRDAAEEIGARLQDASAEAADAAGEPSGELPNAAEVVERELRALLELRSSAP